MRLNKHLFLLTSAIFVSASLFAACARSGADTHSSLPEVAVYKSPTCGCCTDWVAHLEENGFAVRTTEMADVTPIKEDFGVPVRLRSCHTAIVDGYAVEGHVPADDIKRMLRERPEIAGIAVAGMPQGSPGMPGPNPQRYDVTAFLKDGRHFVFAKH
jgi:hypothetical protein